MNTNISTKIGITFFVFLVLLFLVSCNDMSSTSTPKDSNANKSLTANDKQNVQSNQSNSMNSAPQKISNINNASVTNSQTQPSQQGNVNVSVYTAPIQSSKTISYKNLVSMFSNSPNEIAGEEKIKEFFGNQSVLVKNVVIFQIKKDDSGRLLVEGVDMETGRTDKVYFVVDEKDKQKILSVRTVKGSFNTSDEVPEVTIRCTFDYIDHDKSHNLPRLWFNFVSIE